MTPSPARALHVLVVEDDQDSAESMAMVLRVYGHNVHIALNGPDALEHIAVEDPDVVFLDVAMPGMGGLELARRIRERKTVRPPFLLAITGMGREEDYQRSLEAGIDLHLVKPVDLNLLQDFLVRFQRVVT